MIVCHCASLACQIHGCQQMKLIGNRTYSETKTPHKCPSCYGEGARQYNHPFDPQMKTETCKSCEGKGIVWG
jgi:DnaJ-class molecular chaperone